MKLKLSLHLIIVFPLFATFSCALNNANRHPSSTSITALAPLPPQSAVALALSEPLLFLGRAKIDSDTYQSCIYRNNKVYVVDRYCRAGNVPAFGVSIFTPDGFFIRTYLERSDRDQGKFTELSSGIYPESWSWDVSLVKARSSLLESESRFMRASLAEIVNYIKDDSAQFTACNVSRYYREAQCQPEFAELRTSWLPEAQTFWRAPPSEWLSLMQKLEELRTTRTRPSNRPTQSPPGAR